MRKKSEKEKMKKENEKGEITVQHLVIIIVLIIGFLVILFFYYTLFWTGVVDREACHQSVIMRATLSSISGSAGNFVDLKCMTNKICLTSGIIGGKCNNSYGNDVKGIVKAKVSNKAQIAKEISNELVSCWEMMGEGKVDLFSPSWPASYGVGGVYSTCVICSRIAFDMDKLIKDGVIKNKEDLASINLEDYMRTRRMPGKEVTYYDFLAGGNAKFKVEENLFGSSDTLTAAQLDPDNPDPAHPVDPNVLITEREAAPPLDIAKEVTPEIGILFMQISAPSAKKVFWDTGKGLVGLFVGGHFATAGVSTKVAQMGARACWAAKAYCLVPAAIIASIGVGVQQGVTAWNRGTAAGYCGDVSIGGQAREGCSVVRAIVYDESGIRQFCQHIESIS